MIEWVHLGIVMTVVIGSVYLFIYTQRAKRRFPQYTPGFRKRRKKK